MKKIIHRLTHVVLVSGMARQISEKPCDGAQLQVAVCTQTVQQHGQNAFLLQSHTAQH